MPQNLPKEYCTDCKYFFNKIYLIIRDKYFIVNIYIYFVYVAFFTSEG